MTARRKLALALASLLAVGCAPDETCTAPGVLVAITLQADVKADEIVSLRLVASLDNKPTVARDLPAGDVGINSGGDNRFAINFGSNVITGEQDFELTIEARDRKNQVIAVGRIASQPIKVSAAQACAQASVTLQPVTGPDSAIVDLSKPDAKPNLQLTSAYAATGPVVVCDVDNDGKQDVAFAVPNAEGAFATDAAAGRVYLLLGDALGGAQGAADVESVQLALKVVGSAAGQSIGESLACADLDGDGNDDLIVGAPQSDNVAGKVLVFFGKSKPSTTADVEIVGVNAGDRLGASLAVARGFNSDAKLGALVIGAPGASGGAGAAYIVGGRDKGGWGTTVDLSSDGAVLTVVGAAGESLGSAVAAGNLRGDTADSQDVAIGGPTGGKSGCADCGVVRVVAADVIAASATIDVAKGEHALSVWGGSAASKLGASLAIGDHNADGKGDLFIGAPNDEGKGKVYLVFGDAPLLASGGQSAVDIEVKDMLNAVYVGATDSQLGKAVVATGKAGSTADLIVGAPGMLSTRGAVYQFRGRKGFAPKETVQLAGSPHLVKTVLGAKQNDRLGTTAAWGLLSNDTVVDMIIAAPGAKTVYGIFSTQQQ